MAEPGDDPVSEDGELTLAQVAARTGVSAATVRRWLRMGLVPGYEGKWTPSAVAYVRVVARLRARGHTLEQIKRASDSGALAVGPIESLLDTEEGRYSLKQASRESGLDPAVARQRATAPARDALRGLVAAAVGEDARERGHYIHPELYGASEQQSIEWARHPALMQRIRQVRARQLLASQQPAVETRVDRQPLAVPPNVKSRALPAPQVKPASGQKGTTPRK